MKNKLKNKRKKEKTERIRMIRLREGKLTR
jgi:hypothetical protein